MATGEAGDKLVKRVLSHAEVGATAIYNRYAYVREVRKVLTDWANELLATAARDMSVADRPKAAVLLIASK
jgi:hypothetical protein